MVVVDGCGGVANAELLSEEQFSLGRAVYAMAIPPVKRFTNEEAIPPKEMSQTSVGLDPAAPRPMVARPPPIGCPETRRVIPPTLHGSHPLHLRHGFQ
jgi:hypothetical protein